jgi:hypothetical protein
VKSDPDDWNVENEDLSMEPLQVCIVISQRSFTQIQQLTILLYCCLAMFVSFFH